MGTQRKDGQTEAVTIPTSWEVTALGKVGDSESGTALWKILRTQNLTSSLSGFCYSLSIPELEGSLEINRCGS